MATQEVIVTQVVAFIGSEAKKDHLVQSLKKLYGFSKVLALLLLENS